MSTRNNKIDDSIEYSLCSDADTRGGITSLSNTEGNLSDDAKLNEFINSFVERAKQRDEEAVMKKINEKENVNHG